MRLQHQTSCVVSDTSGVTATSLINMICDGKTLTLEDIKSVYHGKLSAKNLLIIS